jgi:hypothetical protein
VGCVLCIRASIRHFFSGHAESCSTITTQIWLSNARSIAGPLNWWLTVDLYFNKKKKLSLKDVTWNNKIIIRSGRHINVVKTIITLIEILHHTLTILWYQEDESILNKKKIKNCCSFLNMTISQKVADKVCASASAPCTHAWTPEKKRLILTKVYRWVFVRVL